MFTYCSYFTHWNRTANLTSLGVSKVPKLRRFVTSLTPSEVTPPRPPLAPRGGRSDELLPLGQGEARRGYVENKIGRSKLRGINLKRE